MIVSIASGKGGTGKTTVAVNLALLLSRNGSQNIHFLDCDVEEPNAHIFLKPHIDSFESVGIPIPEIDEQKCTYCGICAEVCVYNAIAVVHPVRSNSTEQDVSSLTRTSNGVKDKVLIFPELCHGCGGCSLLCPEEAISEKEREIGVLEQGRAEGIKFVHGKLNIGEPMAAPLIRAVKEKITSHGIAIIDVPPGTSCPVIEAVKDSDFTILVTEPTPFGLNDLQLAVETVRKLGLPCGVVINCSDVGDEKVKEYCNEEGIPILAEIPYDRTVAILYSHGIPILIEGEKYRTIFQQMWDSIEKEAKQIKKEKR